MAHESLGYWTNPSPSVHIDELPIHPTPGANLPYFFQYYRPQTHTHTTQAHLTIQFRMSSQLQLQLTSYLTYLQLQYLQLAS